MQWRASVPRPRVNRCFHTALRLAAGAASLASLIQSFAIRNHTVLSASLVASAASARHRSASCRKRCSIDVSVIVCP